MATTFQKAGFPLTVYNRTASKTEPFVAAGAAAADSPKSAAAQGDIVVTSLLDDKSIIGMATADDGILAGLRPDAIHLGTTTISPAAAARVEALHRDHDRTYVGTNVLGRPSAAATGELAALVAGDPAAVERCRPVLEAFTSMLVVVGTQAADAARMKLVINFFLSGLIETMGETYVFAGKHGLELDTVRHLMINQVLPNPALREYADRIKERRFGDAGATLTTSLKDLTLILGEAAAVQAPLPIANLVRDHILSGLALGQGDLDWCVSTEANRRAAGMD